MAPKKKKAGSTSTGRIPSQNTIVESDKTGGIGVYRGVTKSDMDFFSSIRFHSGKKKKKTKKTGTKKSW
jgi:hypothetical protein